MLSDHSNAYRAAELVRSIAQRMNVPIELNPLHVSAFIPPEYSAPILVLTEGLTEEDLTIVRALRAIQFLRNRGEFPYEFHRITSRDERKQAGQCILNVGRWPLFGPITEAVWSEIARLLADKLAWLVRGEALYTLSHYDETYHDSPEIEDLLKSIGAALDTSYPERAAEKAEVAWAVESAIDFIVDHASTMKLLRRSATGLNAVIANSSGANTEQAQDVANSLSEKLRWYQNEAKDRNNWIRRELDKVKSDKTSAALTMHVERSKSLLRSLDDGGL